MQAAKHKYAESEEHNEQTDKPWADMLTCTLTKHATQQHLISLNSLMQLSIYTHWVVVSISAREVRGSRRARLLHQGCGACMLVRAAVYKAYDCAVLPDIQGDSWRIAYSVR
jgi:hypothetical protein